MTVGAGFPRLAAQSGQGGTDGAGCLVPMPIQTWRWEPHSPSALFLSLVEGRLGAERQQASSQTPEAMSPCHLAQDHCLPALGLTQGLALPCVLAPPASPCSVTEGGLVSGFPL